MALAGLSTTDNITYTAIFTPTTNIEDTTNAISSWTSYTDKTYNVDF